MPQFSIIIPSWNNLPLLKLCISSIKKNSHFKNQIIIYVNEGIDGTVEWLEDQQDVNFLHSHKNEGICVALNSCRALVQSEFIIYMNDDMYVCPNWDLELHNEIKRIGHNRFMLSSTSIEPHVVNNPNLISIVQDFGDSLQTFKEEELLNSYLNLHKEDWSGSSWPACVVSTKVWDIVGGYSIEFSPGMYSDPDFSMKLWRYGVRIFKGVGKSKVYHFQSKSTKRLKKNNGAKTFLMKWGITARVFYTHYLRMGKPFDLHALENPGKLSYFLLLRSKLKRAYYALISK